MVGCRLQYTNVWTKITARSTTFCPSSSSLDEDDDEDDEDEPDPEEEDEAGEK